MIQVEGTSSRGQHHAISNAARFFKRIRVIHGAQAGFFLGTGVAALILSLGSDGNAQVPYYFSAFISGVWHIVFVFVCLVCIYYLSKDASRSQDATSWVKGYSINSSVFVLFNVMGVVFTVVNGVCIKDQMCYYDKNEIANRFMAIVLILQHCITIVICVFLTKKAHLIDTELSSDITLRLYHQFDFSKLTARLRTFSKSKPKSEKGDDADGSSSSIPSISTITSSTKDEVFDNTQISAGEMFEKIRKVHKSRSKSHPNLTHDHSGGTEIQGTVVSIYSDADKSHTEQKTLKSKFKVIVKPNKVWPNESRSHHDLGLYRGEDISGTQSDDDVIPPRVFHRKKPLLKPILNQANKSNNGTDNLGYDSGPVDDHTLSDTQDNMLDGQVASQKQHPDMVDQHSTFSPRQIESSSGDAPPPYEESIIEVKPTHDVPL